MDCFYDGTSINWKICWSAGCFNSGNTTVQDPPSVRLTDKQAARVNPGATCSGALPAVKKLGGEIFLATLAATLNLYRDQIDNQACSQSDADYMDTLVSVDTVGWEERLSNMWLDLPLLTPFAAVPVCRFGLLWLGLLV